MDNHPELVHNFGVLPDYVGLGSQGCSPVQLEVGVRYQLELWRAGDRYQLRHRHLEWELPAIDPTSNLRLSFVREGRFPGVSTLVLNGQPRSKTLLTGRFDDVGWMRATAEELGELLDLKLTEEDSGTNDY